MHVWDALTHNWDMPSRVLSGLFGTGLRVLAAGRCYAVERVGAAACRQVHCRAGRVGRYVPGLNPAGGKIGRVLYSVALARRAGKCKFELARSGRIDAESVRSDNV